MDSEFLQTESHGSSHSWNAPAASSCRSTRARHFSSAHEFLRSLENAGSVGLRVVRRRSWPELCLAETTALAAGEWDFAPIGFYLVALVLPGVGETEASTAGPEAMPGSAGSLMLGNMGCSFSQRWAGRSRISWACLDPGLIHAMAAELGLSGPGGLLDGRLQNRADPVLQHLMLGLTWEMRLRANRAQATIVHSLARAMASRLVGRLCNSNTEAPSTDGPNGEQSFPGVRRYISENLGERISLDDLARVAGCSRFHFARQFRQSMAESPMGYLTRIRVEKAKLMLRQGNRSVADIAAELGFADQSHFSRTFRRFVGIPPSRFAQ